jgi:hypothetical protein
MIVVATMHAAARSTTSPTTDQPSFVFAGT